MKTLEEQIDALVRKHQRETEIIAMRADRYSYRVIGEKYGISKQRVFEIIKAHKTKKGGE